ncbi:hypothetical protein CRV15_11770 [Streptomyces clavuligerus]|uniref:Uncharacterized protein n=1 Tax=Streptomyces clavuligerus TaxID=1901 RepID=B5H0J6_STRCL|nr:hypothetical protein D1794_12340 [Streptomyces clavuligerus]EDY52092.1 hypothetical protein SSCG_05160 [Streptomyces clavuligerus]EFG08414.1 Hypothetical protein SCLAV_3343 [Streptomyces clavuligerus]QCS06243.1 hypothetical protein CRV15_11770 [Streptomyces clavuligerus]QPJ94401.1 hypothetical protein GE265_16200 [Streptomyces clavuligerus]
MPGRPRPGSVAREPRELRELRELGYGADPVESVVCEGHPGAASPLPPSNADSHLVPRYARPEVTLR